MSEREKRTKQEKATRARWGEQKTVQIRHKRVVKEIDGEEKEFLYDHGLPDGEVTLEAGYCPCSICGHEYMWECHDADCQCCTSACT